MPVNIFIPNYSISCHKEIKMLSLTVLTVLRDYAN